MDPSFSSLHNVGWFELRETLKPQTSGFGLSVTMLPRLNYLVRFAPFTTHDSDWVFNGYFRHRGVCQLHKKLDGFCLLLALEFEPSCAA